MCHVKGLLSDDLLDILRARLAGRSVICSLASYETLAKALLRKAVRGGARDDELEGLIGKLSSGFRFLKDEETFPGTELYDLITRSPGLESVDATLDVPLDVPLDALRVIPEQPDALFEGNHTYASFVADIKSPAELRTHLRA